jgi:hypothetical protein
MPAKEGKLHRHPGRSAWISGAVGCAKPQRPPQLGSDALPPQQSTSDGCSVTVHVSANGISGGSTCPGGRHARMEIHEADTEHLSSTVSFGDGTGPDITMDTVSSWQGECPAGMQDGHLKLVSPSTERRG